MRDPDALYRDREHLPSARAAAEIWEARLAANPRDFESAWKLSRARYWLGGRGPDRDARKRDLERGIAAADQAIAVAPDRPEGHFWRAANMGGLAESFGMRQGLRYRGAIKASLETVLRLDPTFQQGSADRALGRWYYKVPGLFGGSRTKSEEHLRKSLAYNPNSHASRFFLAETLFAMARDEEAIEQLEALIAASLDPEWAPEDREFKQKARALLAERAGEAGILPPGRGDAQSRRFAASNLDHRLEQPAPLARRTARGLRELLLPEHESAGLASRGNHVNVVPLRSGGADGVAKVLFDVAARHAELADERGDRAGLAREQVH